MNIVARFAAALYNSSVPIMPLRPRVMPYDGGLVAPKERVMEGRYPNGLIFALTNCANPEKEAEFNRWYNHIHLPDASAPGIFVNPMRLANADPKPGEPGYLAMGECTWDDVSAAWEVQQQQSPSRQNPERMSPLVDVQLVGLFKKLGGQFRSAIRPVAGNLVVLLNCDDQSREGEFNRWYNDVHIPDVLDTGLYHTAYRYESLDIEGSKGKYLNLFETDRADPGQALRELTTIGEEWEQQGRMFDGMSLIYTLAMRRVWPMD